MVENWAFLDTKNLLSLIKILKRKSLEIINEKPPKLNEK